MGLVRSAADSGFDAAVNAIEDRLTETFNQGFPRRAIYSYDPAPRGMKYLTHVPLLLFAYVGRPVNTHFVGSGLLRT